jgi:glycosyltransferase involved in cell wall biosynthesis
VRVLLVSHRFPPDGIAGVERYTQRLAAELSAAGDTVSILTRRPAAEPIEPRTIRERTADGITIHRLVGGTSRPDRFLANHERLERLFTAALIEAAPDVVHFNHLIDLPPRCMSIARRYGAAVVLTLHDYYFACPLFQLRKHSGELCAGPDGGDACARTCFSHEGPAAAPRWKCRSAYFRKLLAVADRVIAPSQYLASAFARLGIEHPHLEVVPNGVLIDPPAAWELSSVTPERRGSLNLAFIGMVVPHKGVHVILEALSIAGAGSVNLVILGQIQDRQYGHELRERAAQIPGLKFRMYGAYRLNELRYLLNNVDCVLVPSQWPENFPLVTQEALAYGIPLVASRLGGLTEIVSEGQNGLTFEHDRPEQLAAILRRLSQEADLLARLRQGARATKVTTMSSHAATIRALYQAALVETSSGVTIRRSENQELETLYAALLDLGFDPAV